MLADITRTTAEAFDAFVALPENRTRHFELVMGEITEKMVSGPVSSRLTGRLMAFVAPFVVMNDLGEITPADGGYWVGDDRYIPDISFIRKDRVNIGARQGYVMAAPDLAVEVVSATDNPQDMAVKIFNYVAAGTVVWRVDPVAQVVTVFEPGKPAARFTRTMTLTGGAVLPGFSLDLALLFREVEQQ